MKILITGATGLIGRALVAQWQDQHQLVILSRSVAKAREILAIDASYHQSLDEIDFNQLDAVVNLAGEAIADKRWSESQKQKKNRTHCTGQPASDSDQGAGNVTPFSTGSPLSPPAPRLDSLYSSLSTDRMRSP